MDVAIVDYGAGNLASVARACRHLGAITRVTAAAEGLAAHPIIVPGVGHFARTEAIGGGMRRALVDAAAAGVPLLGICLGLQWLFDGSTEAPDVPGAGVFRGTCDRLVAAGVKIPHVGWNTLDTTGRPSRLLAGVPAGACVYFTHAYAAPLCADTVACTTHGGRFTAAVERGCVWAVQFHPEKSGATGLRILANFLSMAGAGA